MASMLRELSPAFRFARLIMLFAAAHACGGRTDEPETQRMDGGASGSGGNAGSSGLGGSSAAGPGGGFGGTGATGGSGGMGATGGADATGGATGAAGAAPAGICTSDSDCRIAQDCCACAALGPGDEANGCGDVCGATQCGRWGFRDDEARCVAGRCVLDRRCDASCSGPPSCSAGEQPFLDQAGYCENVCLPPTQCSQVLSCAVCEAVGAACVIYLTEGRGSESFHCVRVPEGCDGSCECMRVCSEDTVCQPPSSEKALRCYRDCPSC
jgi:hypothetical protein